MRSIDVVIPMYNEQECVAELARRLKQVFDAEPDYRWRAICVENGSADSTWELLAPIAREDERFTVLRLSRNFHMDGGLTAGLEFLVPSAGVSPQRELSRPLGGPEATDCGAQ